MPARSAISRRRFLMAGSGFSLGIAVMASPGALAASQRILGANERIRLTVCGIRKRGFDHVRLFSEIPNVTVAALIERASGVNAFFVGKPNPLMMRLALNSIGAHSESTVMVGDRMDTAVIGGVQTGMETILVLSGVTRREEVERFPYQPTRVVNSVADIMP